MSTTNLGRVQGAGFFYANTTSSTSVNKSSLTPSSIPALVGDTILFSDGDVRTITAVNTSTVTCGNVITSLKGPQGVQGPTGPTGPSGLESMSEAQLAAINSGINSEKVAKIDNMPIVELDSLDDAPEPTDDNKNHLYVYDRNTYKWWINGKKFNNEITNDSTQYANLDGTTGEVINLSHTSSNRYYYVTPFLPVYPNSSYNGYVHWSTGGVTKYACYYDENQNFISSFSYSSYGSSTETYLTNIPTNAKYIRFAWYSFGYTLQYAIMGLNKAFVSSTSSANRIFATDNDGAQTTLTYGIAATADYIVQRKTGGQITVPTTPSANTDAASKSYVDGNTINRFNTGYDFNDHTKIGVYPVYPDTPNTPDSAWGVVLAFCNTNEANWVVQLYFSHSNKDNIKLRHYVNDAWSSWAIIR